MLPTSDEQIRFLVQIQRLLDEGLFVATYKFALLQSLADIAIEQGDDSEALLAVSTDAIAEKFIRYYCDAVSAAVDTRVLQENTGRQAAVMNVVRRARAALDRYREKVTTVRVTDRASSAITKPTPIHPPTLCRCVVCGRQSRWIDPFPPIPRSWGRGRRPKQYVFT